MPLPTNFLGMDNDDVEPVPKRSRRVMLGAKTAIKRLLLEKQPVTLEALCGGGRRQRAIPCAPVL